MSPAWWRAEPATPVPASDIASEIVWDSLAGIAVLDFGGRFAYSNPAFQRSPALLALFDPRGYLTSEPLERLRREVVLRRGSGGRTTSVVVDGKLVDAEVIPLRAAPDWTALVGRPRDQDQELATDRFSLAILVHELRGSLLLAQESLEGLTQLAGEGTPELNAALARHARSLGRLGGLVRGLTDLSSARELGENREPWAPINLGRLVEEVGNQYRELAESGGHRLEVDADLTVPEIQGQPDLLSRAVANLVDNALKHSASGSAVRLRLTRRGALAVVEVGDDGPGIGPEDQIRIFNEFVRLPQTQAPGSGLGLAVSRKVAESHGGRLSLESQLGTGSVFRLSFLLDWDTGRNPHPQRAAAW